MGQKEIVPPRKLRRPSTSDPGLWETNDYRTIQLSSMSDAHLEASIRLFLGIRMDERKYMTLMGQSDSLKDPILQYRLNQLRTEWARRNTPKSTLSKFLGKLGL